MLIWLETRDTISTYTRSMVWGFFFNYLQALLTFWFHGDDLSSSLSHLQAENDVLSIMQRYFKILYQVNRADKTEKTTTKPVFVGPK